MYAILACNSIPKQNIEMEEKILETKEGTDGRKGLEVRKEKKLRKEMMQSKEGDRG